MVVLILAIFFILCVYPLISIHKNKKNVEEGIEIGREFDKNSLYEELQNRSFSYPLLKRIKKGYNGWPALEGRISTYIIYSEGTKIFVKDFKEYEGIHKEYFSLLDKKIIKTYIEKFFNKDRDVFVNSKGDIAKIYIVKIVKALCIAVVLVSSIKGLYENYEVFKENTRECTSIKTNDMGLVTYVEVGALLVGKIENKVKSGMVKKGLEKGYFKYGGSTIVLLFEKNKIALDEEIINNSLNGLETYVKYGEKIGEKKK